MARLFVGNLPYSATDDDLLEMFAPFAKNGELSDAKVLLDHHTGKSRGFGFVTLDSDTDADAAIECLNETDYGGRTIRVDRANPRTSGGGGGGGQRAYDGVARRGRRDDGAPRGGKGGKGKNGRRERRGDYGSW